MSTVQYRRVGVLLISGLIVAGGTTPSLPDGRDPFSWLHPVISLDAPARNQLDRGEVVVKVLPAHGGEIAVFAASRLEAEPEMLGLWAAAITDLKKSPYVLAVRRFSDPPVIGDLDTLVFDDADLESVRRCTPGDCELKLSTGDIESLRLAANVGGTEWKHAVQRQLRQTVLDRVTAHRAKGLAGLSPYADRRKPTEPGAAFTQLLEHSPYLLSEAISSPSARTESFFYWSKEHYGVGKPVVTATHVDVIRPQIPGSVRVAVVSTEILATHYRNASIGLTAVVEESPGRRYLVYVNRSQLDVLGGFFGGLKRAILEGRLEKESAQVFETLRTRLESGPPTVE